MSAPNISLLGAVYPEVSGVTLPKQGGGTASFPWVEGSETKTQNGTYDVTNLAQLIVNVSGGGGAYAWLGSGAEKIDTKDFSFNLSRDTSYNSWTPSTTATAIVAAKNSVYTYTGSVNSYDFCFVFKGFIEPVYVSGTPATYRTHRVAQYNLYYIYGYPVPNTTAQVQTDTAGNIAQHTTSSNAFIQYYYNNGGTLVSRSATQCGPCYMSSYPTINTSLSSGNVSVTVNFPAFNAKCDSSRFSTTRAGQVDSANTNYSLTLEVFRVPHGNGLASHLISEMCAALNAP